MGSPSLLLTLINLEITEMDCDKAHGYWQLILIDAVTKLSEWMAGPSEYPGYTIADVEQNYVAVEGDALKYAVISITW